MGYHAISIVGYDEEGFFIRNSWGSGFADRGYTHIKNNDMDKMLEMWTIID
jgi:C1A family cysteine protease